MEEKEKLLSLYLQVASFKRGCKLTAEEQNTLRQYQIQLSKFTNYPVRTSVCNRYKSVDQGRKILTAHGKL